MRCMHGGEGTWVRKREAPFEEVQSAIGVEGRVLLHRFRPRRDMPDVVQLDVRLSNGLIDVLAWAQKLTT